jgi:hypothetical protein
MPDSDSFHIVVLFVPLTIMYLKNFKPGQTGFRCQSTLVKIKHLHPKIEITFLPLPFDGLVIGQR